MKGYILYKKPEHIGRPRKGKDVKEHASIRIEHKYKDIIIKKFGSIQKWIDSITKRFDFKE